MTIALIGLIGVLAGALVAGLFTYQVERRRRIDTAQAAGHLILGELQVVSAKMQGVTGQPDELPTQIWNARAAELALDRRIDPNLLTSLVRAYGVVDIYNRQRAKAEASQSSAPVALRSLGGRLINRLLLLGRPGDAAPEPPADETHLADAQTVLDDNRKYIEEIRQQLARELNRLAGLGLKRIWKTVGVPALIVGLLATATWLGALERPEVNAQTVAATLQSHLGSDALVDCDPDGRDWICSMYPANISCPVTAAATTSATSSRGGILLVRAEQRALQPVPKRATDCTASLVSTVAAVNTGPEIQYTPRTVSSLVAAQTAALRAPRSDPTSKSNLFKQLWRRLTGETRKVVAQHRPGLPSNR